MMEYYQHPQAIVDDGALIGRGTRVWANAHVLAGAIVGSECNVCDGVFIENGVTVGDRVTLKCGVYLWTGVRLHDDVFVGPNATFVNDNHPRSRQYPEQYLTTTVEKGASIGAGAVILGGVTVGRGAMVAAGAVVTANVPPHAVVAGNPARVTGYTVTADADNNEPRSHATESEEAAALGVTGARLLTSRIITDPRGSLVAAQGEALPFEPRRYFLVYDVPTKEVRGEHAHKECHQLLVCVAGSVHVSVDDGSNRASTVLDSPNRALYIPAGIWASQYRYDEHAVLMVLASHPYDADDYIRDYEGFLHYRAVQDS